MSWPTAKRWASRYELEGEAGMLDRSSRPHHMPTKTPQPQVRAIVHLRWKHRLGPVEIAARVGMAASTVGAVLRRCGISRLSQVDRATGEPVCRYEHPTRARSSMSMSRSWATSLTRADGVITVVRSDGNTAEPPPPASLVIATTNR